MCIRDRNYENEIVKPMKCDDLCEQINIFLKGLTLPERQKMGEQLIQFIVLDTKFGIENTKLPKFFDSLLAKWRGRLGLDTEG